MSALKLAPQTAGAALAQDWLEHAQQTGQTDTYAGKRQHPRSKWEAGLEIHVEGRRGRRVTYYASARDISAGGIGLRCRAEIKPCTPVTVCLAGQLEGVPAMVMHCTRSVADWVIGLEFRFEQAAKAVPVLDKKVG